MSFLGKFIVHFVGTWLFAVVLLIFLRAAYRMMFGPAFSEGITDTEWQITLIIPAVIALILGVFFALGLKLR